MTKLILTAEQNNIIACNDNLIFVEAKAGSSKTTTLIKYAEARPREKILYIAYNAAIAKEAESRFPSNVKCATIHAMAFAVCGVKYRSKLGNVRAMDVASSMNVDFKEAIKILSILNKYLTGVERKITLAMIHNAGYTSFAAEAMKNKVEALWAKMIDMNDKMPMSHDGYLKLYQLSGDALSGYGVIMLDEKQDANPIAMDIVLNAGGRKIMVGDKYQSIYAFRGATNDVQKMAKPDVIFNLTGSFRFGNKIAELANGLLILSGEKTLMKGLAKCDGKIYLDTPITQLKLASTESRAYIARTNSALFLQAIELMDANIPFAFNSGDEKLDIILDANHLFENRQHLIKDNFLKKFKTFSEANSYAESAEDKELSTLLSIVKKYDNIEKLIDQVKLNSKKYTGKEYMLTTIHSSKGKEWDSVTIADDYFPLKKLKEKIITKELQQEINCLYVQITRAKKQLHIPAPLYDFVVNLNPNVKKNTHHQQTHSNDEKTFEMKDLFN